MKTYFVTFIFIVINIYCNAQIQDRIQYSYDLAGNRISRQFCHCRLANPEDSVMQEKYGLTVYPNPATESINIKIVNLNKESEAIVMLFDEQGKQLWRSKQKEEQQTINISSYSTGIYFLRVQIEKDVLSYRIQKN